MTTKATTEVVTLLAVLLAMGPGVYAGEASATAALTPAQARCGNLSGYPDYYDVRARRVGCPEAKRVARTWAGAFTNVFKPIRVRGFRCAGTRSRRRIRGVRAFRIDCRRTREQITWWIRPYH